MRLLCIGLVIIIIIVLIASSSYKEPFLEKQHVLGLLLCAKNEGMVITEFINHYIWQGVDILYVIDNGSTDDMKLKLQPFISSGKVKYFYKEEPYSQEKHYNEVYNIIKNECKWLIVCDTDEYIYNRTPGKTIKDYLNTISYDDIAIVYLQWKMFGSSGFETQPSSIRQSFIYRAQDINPHTKAIVNTSLVTVLHVHDSEFEPTKQTINYPPELALNHYAIMSKEYFQKIKMTRGDATTREWNSVRDWKYFSDYDKNEVRDIELAQMLQ